MHYEIAAVVPPSQRRSLKTGFESTYKMDNP
jgi:hypothetical protein